MDFHAATDASVIPSHNLKDVTPSFGQIVIGPPGSGKTTYCHKMSEFLKKINRKVTIINLDPANENMKYKPDIDVMDLITVSDVMDSLNLGPNGALMYCMEHLEKNLDWLLEQLERQPHKYFIFDCPGQVELYTHHTSMRNMLEQLQKLPGLHMCSVQLVDSHYCSDAGKFIATLLMSLSAMLQLGLPHVNVLSKADMFSRYQSRLAFGLDFYTDVLDLQYLLEALDSGPGGYRHAKLNAALVSLVEDYSLVSFQLLDSNNEESILKLKNTIDKVNGYVFGAGEERSIQALLACAVGAQTQTDKAEEMEKMYS